MPLDTQTPNFVIAHEILNFTISESVSPAQWNSILPSCRREQIFCAHIWDAFSHGQPLAPYTNDSIVARHIRDDLRAWLWADSLHPMKIPQYLGNKQHIDLQQIASGISTIPRESLQLLFNYVKQIAEKQLEHRLWPLPGTSNHLQWVGQYEVDYPEPNFGALVSKIPCNAIDSVLLLLRSATYFDTGADCMFERYIKSAISLLFGDDKISFISETDCMSSTASHSQREGHLVVAGGCSDFTPAVRQEMAAHAQWALHRIVEKFQELDLKELPKYAFVYGIHWSPTRVRILIHFPSFNAEASRWDFCQIIAAEHYNGFGLNEELSGIYRLYEDDMFLYRWRLVIALFTIRTQVDTLTGWLTSANPPGTISLSDRGAIVHPQSRDTHKQDGAAFLDHTIWSEPFRIPNAWISSKRHLSTSLNEPSSPGDNYTSYKIARLSMLPLSILSDYIHALSDDDLGKSRGDPTDPRPDYLLNVNLARCKGLGGNRCEVYGVHDDHDSRAQLHKFHDSMHMQLGQWHDANIHIANVFAGFEFYLVHWNPQMPPGILTGQKVNIDFILTIDNRFPFSYMGVKEKPPRNLDESLEENSPEETPEEKEINEELELRLSTISPVVLLGLRCDDHTEESHSSLTLADRHKLSTILHPYVETLARHRHVLDFDGIASTALFCTYLKAGYLHVIAAPLKDLGPDSCQIVLIDTLPIVTNAQTREHYLSRMRLHMVLLALQKQVVRLYKQCSDAVWPAHLIAEESSFLQNGITPEASPPQPIDEFAWSSSSSQADASLNSDYEPSDCVQEEIANASVMTWARGITHEDVEDGEA